MPSETGHPPARPGGYTLLETALSACLVALILAIAPAGYREFSHGWRSREAALLALGTLRRARWLAVTVEREHAVIFSRSADGTWTSSLLKRDGEAWVAAEKPRPYPRDVSLVAVTGPSVKEFNPDGTSSSGSVVLRCGDRGYRLTLTPATGRIRLRKD